MTAVKLTQWFSVMKAVLSFAENVNSVQTNGFQLSEMSYLRATYLIT